MKSAKAISAALSSIHSRVLILSLLCVLPIAEPRAQVSSLRPGVSAPDLVLERDDWTFLQPLSMEELLRHQVGIVVARRGGLGSPEYVNIAGSVVGSVRVVVDGIEYNEPELTWPRLFAIQVSSLERIELHRTTDPARLEIWTRSPPEAAPLTEIDVSTGSLDTGTRRVQLLTPTRAVRVGVRYEELLRGETDFRRERPQSPPDLFGSYDGRGIAIEAEFVRPNGEKLLLRHQDFNDNAHGSFQALQDFTSSIRILNGLRWQRRIGSVGMWFDASQMTWDRDRRIAGLQQQVSESRKRLAMDLEMPPTRGWQPDLRIRATDVKGERNDEEQRYAHRVYDLELQASRTGTVAWNTWGAVHRNTDLGNSWSARLHARWKLGNQSAFAQVGRGVTFGRGAESPAETPDSPRTGGFVAAGVTQHGDRVRMQMIGYYKHLQGYRSAARFFFPDLGDSPRDIAGLLGSISLQQASNNYLYDIGASLSWTPYVASDAGGLANLQGEVSARISRKEWFQGDLIISLASVWHLETERQFSSTSKLPAFAVGDLLANARILKRIVFFYSINNVLDSLYDSYPGVLMPGRRTEIGIRVGTLN